MAQEKWLIDGPKVIDIGLIRSLKISLVAGQIDIVGHDEPDTRIEVHSVTGKDLSVSINGDALEIDHPQLRWDNFVDVFTSFRGNARADVSIMVPREIALKFGVVSASALVSGLTGDASISTVTGDVVADGLTGDLTLNSVSGEISVRDHTGTIAAHSVNGDITATGAISRFTSEAVSGNVVLDLDGQPGAVRVNTVTGSITARLTPEVATEYRINSATGKINLDGAEVATVRGSYVGKFGELDKTWLEFRANTVSGTVSVLHAVSA
jgi:DUF4097 and DUF4098 domain-containing protein YvlB